MNRSWDNIFEYNQHFVAMMNVINAARLNPPTKGHKHHIIPRCWFKKNNLPVDNSDDNIVLLTEEDHAKVHKLAAMCIVGSDMRSAMGFAVHRLHGSFSGMHHTEETKKKMSKSRKGKIPKNLENLHKAQIGRKRSEITLKRMSEGRKGKGKDKSSWNKGKHYSNKLKGMKWKVVNNKRVWYKVEE